MGMKQCTIRPFARKKAKGLAPNLCGEVENVNPAFEVGLVDSCRQAGERRDSRAAVRSLVRVAWASGVSFSPALVR